MSAFGPARAKTRIFEKWVEYQEKKILEKPCCFAWGVFGPKSLDTKQWAEEFRANWTIYKGYTRRKTVDQLIRLGISNLPFALFSDYEKKLIPLNSSPYIFWHLSGTPKKFLRMSIFEELSPHENMTIFSAFAGYALMDCWSKYEYITENKLPDSGWLDAKETLKFLKRIDHRVCEKLKLRSSTADS